MPCPFTGRKMFCDGLNLLSQPKHLTAFIASSKTLVPTQKPILLNANHFFGLAQNFCEWQNMYLDKFIVRRKKFGTAQNILQPVKGLVPCPFTSPKMFWADPVFLCQIKNLFSYCGTQKHFVPDKKMICIQ